MKYISTLLQSGHTIYTYDFLQDILKITNRNTLKAIVQRLTKAHILYPIYNGMRRLDAYDPLELACKLKSPSYISLETVLQKEGVIFQDYSKTTTLVWINTITMDISDHQYSFRKLKTDLLLNPLGIYTTQVTAIASKERAICDILYYTPDYYFDHIWKIDIDLMQQLIPSYPKSTQDRLYSIIQTHVTHSKS